MRKKRAGVVGLLGVGCIIMLGVGCAKKAEPPPEKDLTAVVDGQVIEIGSQAVTIRSDRISDFQVVDLVSGPEGRTMTAVLSFDYPHRGGTYRVEGVVSYSLEGDDRFAKPRFEVSDIRKAP